jgi:hypothetical protein
MGWIDRIFSFFFTAEDTLKNEIEIVHVNDLDSWLESQRKESIAKHNLDEELTNYVNALKDKRWLIECKVDDWEERARNAGHRNEENVAIFVELKRLLDLLNIPESPKLDSIRELNSRFGEHVEKLHRKVEGSSFMYNFSFLLKEEERTDTAVNPLLKELLELDKLRKSFEEKAIECGLIKINVLKEKAERLDYYVEKIRVMTKELDSKSLRFKSAEARRKEKHDNLQQLKQSSEYTSLADNKARKREILSKLENNEDELFTYFSKLKPTLRKYSYFDPSNRFLLDYLESPINTFREDKNMVILNILKDFKESLLTNMIKLEPEQQNVITSLLDKAEAGYLQQLRKNNQQIKEELIMLKEVAGNRDFLLKVEDAQYRFNHFYKQVEKLREEALSLESDVKELTSVMDKELELFRNMVKVSLERSIEIKV